MPWQQVASHFTVKSTDIFTVHNRMQQSKFVKLQDSHPHNQHIRGATVVLNLYIIMYQSSINVTPTLLSLQ